MPAISLAKGVAFRMVRCGVWGAGMWHFKWNTVEGKRKGEAMLLFPGSLIFKYLKNDVTNIQHRRGDVKCFANYFRL